MSISQLKINGEIKNNNIENKIICKKTNINMPVVNSLSLHKTSTTQQTPSSQPLLVNNVKKLDNNTLAKRPPVPPPKTLLIKPKISTKTSESQPIVTSTETLSPPALPSPTIAQKDIQSSTDDVPSKKPSKTLKTSINSNGLEKSPEEISTKKIVKVKKKTSKTSIKPSTEENTKTNSIDVNGIKDEITESIPQPTKSHNVLRPVEVPSTTTSTKLLVTQSLTPQTSKSLTTTQTNKPTISLIKPPVTPPTKPPISSTTTPKVQAIPISTNNPSLSVTPTTQNPSPQQTLLRKSISSSVVTFNNKPTKESSSLSNIKSVTASAALPLPVISVSSRSGSSTPIDYRTSQILTSKSCDIIGINNYCLSRDSSYDSLDLSTRSSISPPSDDRELVNKTASSNTKNNSTSTPPNTSFTNEIKNYFEQPDQKTKPKSPSPVLKYTTRNTIQLNELHSPLKFATPLVVTSDKSKNKHKTTSINDDHDYSDSSTTTIGTGTDLTTRTNVSSPTTKLLSSFTLNELRSPTKSSSSSITPTTTINDYRSLPVTNRYHDYSNSSSSSITPIRTLPPTYPSSSIIKRSYSPEYSWNDKSSQYLKPRSSLSLPLKYRDHSSLSTSVTPIRITRPLTTYSPDNSIGSNSISSRYDRPRSIASCTDRSTPTIIKSMYREPSPSTVRVTPRRIFPQSYSTENSLNLNELNSLESSPVVFDGRLSFDLVQQSKQKLRQSLQARPAHSDKQTKSNYLSEQINNFLKRTDHVMDEWKTVGSGVSTNDSGNCSSVSVDGGRTGRSIKRYNRNNTDIGTLEKRRLRDYNNEKINFLNKSSSATSIMIKGFQMTPSMPPTNRTNSVSRDSSSRRDGVRPSSVIGINDSEFYDDDNTIKTNEFDDELSEMTIDLTEERSASNIVTERLELETAERLKLEKQLQEQQDKIQTLQDTSEKLEMELICAKSDLNGISEDDDLDNDETGSSSVYRLKYERLAKELEYTKRRLQTQHEHDLEQLVGLKKQLEKKLADAYEEVEEQRQVVTQWKRKVQKLSNEMNDLRMLLEQQNERNNLLEKRQRKFDLECQSLQDATRQERQARERLSREKDVLIAEKFTLEQNLADSRLELDMKEEKYASLQREYEELSYGGGTEEEISQLKRAKLDSERKCKDQEEELDELAGQIQILEQTKLRLEMSLETMRKEARREAQQRDEELEEARGSSFKKMKVLECQLENEHEERTQILREKHELERRLQNVEELYQMSKASEDSVNQKLKRDLRKYKALLKDAQIQLERAKTETPGKIVIRQLRNQIEDAETARDMAIKSKQIAENELADLQVTYDEAVRTRSDAEDKSQQLQRDRNELQTQLEENEEEMSEVMKKYSTTVRQLNSEQLKISEYDLRINELESEKHSLKEQVDELHSRLENMSSHNDPLSNVVSKRLELRVKELESRLELEQATRGRIEIQSNRHKDSLEKAQSEIAQAKSKEILAIDGQKKLQKNIRELRENLQTALNREQDSVCKRKELEKRIESAEAESVSVKNDLRLALQRISDLQQAMEEGDEDSSDNSNTSDESLSDQDERIYTRKFPKTNNIDNLSVNLNNGKNFKSS